MAVVHLVRHGEVENPKSIMYGRLPGFHLSERGRKQAAAAAAHMAPAKLAEVRASPMERAQETAAVIAEPRGLDIVTDERLIEIDNVLEGVVRVPGYLFRAPHLWWRLRNPLRPSWGEPYREVRDRMVAAIQDAVAAVDWGEVVLVSHQTPIVIATSALLARRGMPWMHARMCPTGSVTTLELEGRRALSVSYYQPDV